MKIAALFLAFSVLVIAGCQQDNPGGSETTPPSGGNPNASANGKPDVNITPAVAYADVQSALTENCVQCHGATNPKEGINFTSYETLMKGGEHGPVVVAGNPEESVIMHVLRASHGKPQMPPAGPLPEEKIQVIENWIKSGAKGS